MKFVVLVLFSTKEWNYEHESSKNTSNDNPIYITCKTVQVADYEPGDSLEFSPLIKQYLNKQKTAGQIFPNHIYHYFLERK